MKRIVVFGGLGLIGSHLCCRLADIGEEVVCIDIRDIEESMMVFPYYRDGRISYINHNIITPLILECDQIYNLASPTSFKHFQGHLVSLLRTNIVGTLNSLDLALRNRASVVYASSGDVYGSVTHNLSRESDIYAENLTTYAEGKRAAEAVCHAYRNEYDMQCGVARIFTTYGSGCRADDSRVVMRMIFDAISNRDIVIYGNGEQMRTFCWVGDVVDALIRLMALPQQQSVPAINIGSSHEVSIRHLAEMIIALSASRSRIVHTTPRRDDSRRVAPDLTLAHSLLDWTPTTSLSHGLQLTIEYARQYVAQFSSMRSELI